MKVDSAWDRLELAEIGPQARDAERAGYDAVWLAENAHDPLLGAAMAAAGTESVTVGTNITVAFARNPMSVAYSARDLHTLAQGRFVLGLGSQVRGHIERRFSMAWSDPTQRMCEYVAALRAIWSSWNEGTRLNFQGDYYTHTLMNFHFTPEPCPYGAPPVFVAAAGRRMAEVAGQVADGIFCHPLVSERWMREVTLPALERGAARSGRSLEGFPISGALFLAPGETEEELTEAREKLRHRLAFYSSTPAYRPVLELHGLTDLHEELHRLSRSQRWAEMATLVDDKVVDLFGFTGTPDGIRDGVQRRFGDVFARVTPITVNELPTRWPDILR